MRVPRTARSLLKTQSTGNQKKKVAVVGLGYAGLPTLVAIAKTNRYDVVGFDIDQRKIDLIARHTSPIEDSDVNEYLMQHTLTVSTKSAILKDTDVFIICVPTPVHEDHTPDYSYIIASVKTIAPFIRPGGHIVLESTVNPGTSREIIIPVLKEHSQLQLGRDYNLAHCPERINPGDTGWNMYNINRNIGSYTRKANKQIANFYRSFIIGAKVNEVSSLEVAEASKIVENTFRDINIAFVNELAQSFDKMGIDLYETITAASTKPIAFIPHWPGCGVGGHCIAVDPYYLISKAETIGFEHRLLKVARQVNNSMPHYTVNKLVNGLNKIGFPIKGTKIALLGLSYKPNLWDTRESPALVMKKRLEELGARLSVYDPFVNGKYTNLREAIRNVAAIVLATAHQEFIDQLPTALKKTKVKVLVDGRNCLPKSAIQKLGITYIGIGR